MEREGQMLGEQQDKTVRRPGVMVVEDEAPIRNLVVTLLKRQGYAVEGRESGEACLEAVRGGFRGVILLDLNLGGVSGWEVLRTIVENGWNEGMVVCMLTGSLMEGEVPDGVGGVAEHVTDYLAKPFTPGALVELVERAGKSLELQRVGG
ncbi:MAG: response regulator [Limisphaerales bacterium]|jgi:CheY-like chemotaxis protein